ncbi:DUF6401 family natural product biosynthesis protein [Streptacidiphilus sp. EB129]|jgi:hypothetical protein|uniref:DUF6401 family natural product biosynthesis protein n=1 Tax=Streptacidiphilus sp. EB129 TaxID=3156262 RepID=UPI0035138CC1
MSASPDDAAPRDPLSGLVAAYTPRFAEFAFEPGFLAAVDQHVAAVRERLHASGPELELRPVDREALADYALGFTDVLAENGWCEPVGQDFAVCRLTAICWLVHRHQLLAA